MYLTIKPCMQRKAISILLNAWEIDPFLHAYLIHVWFEYQYTSNIALCLGFDSTQHALTCNRVFKTVKADILQSLTVVVVEWAMYAVHQRLLGSTTLQVVQYDGSRALGDIPMNEPGSCVEINYLLESLPAGVVMAKKLITRG